MAKVTIDAYGYDFYTRPVLFGQAVCHIGVGFIVVYFQRHAKASTVMSNSEVCAFCVRMCAQTLDNYITEKAEAPKRQ